jgi:hypothetical protein
VDNGKEFAEHVAWIEALDVEIRSKSFLVGCWILHEDGKARRSEPCFCFWANHIF